MINRNFTLPTLQEIEALHRKHAPSPAAFDVVYTHCLIVSEIALQLVDQSQVDVDKELVRAGCLLHDIGVYRLFDADGTKIINDRYITHGVEGESILLAEGLPMPLARFASHHTGAGLTKEEIITQNLPLPHKDFLAETAEEEVVMYADKFHSKSTPPVFNSYEFYSEYTKRFGLESSANFEHMAMKFGVPNLKALVATYKQGYREIA